MQLLVFLDGSVKLLLAHVTPRAHTIAHNFDIEFRHAAQSWPEHSRAAGESLERKGTRLQVPKVDSVVFDEGEKVYLYRKVRK